MENIKQEKLIRNILEYEGPMAVYVNAEEGNDENVGTISENGVFTATSLGETEIQLMLGDEVIGSKKIYVVIPDNIYFEKQQINAIYGEEKVLPIKAVFEGKSVSINESDIIIALDNPEAGTIDGYSFTGNEESGLKNIKVVAEDTNGIKILSCMLKESLYTYKVYQVVFTTALVLG